MTDLGLSKLDYTDTKKIPKDGVILGDFFYVL